MNASDWSGSVGDVWAREWRRTDRSFADLARRLDAVAAAAAMDGTRIVDIGCGAGATAIALATAKRGVTVAGIDLSPDLVAVARRRGADVPNVSFTCADVAAGAGAVAPVDGYVSRHGVMFFADPVAAFTALADAAAPGATLVFSCFADRRENRWAAEIVTAAGGDGDAPADTTPGPFAFADPAHVAAILTAAGWRAGPPESIAFAYRAGGGADPVADAVDFFGRIGPAAPLLRTADASKRHHVVARLAQVCERHHHGDAVDFPASAWLWSAHRSTERTAA